MPPLPPASTPPAADSLITYPCRFPIKVMGANTPEYVQAIKHVAQAFDPDFNDSCLEIRPSKAGNYLGLTLTIHAVSRAQLDELYRTLSSHPLVKVVL